MGVALLLGLTSCQSTSDGGYSGEFEEATLMSDELPPWVTEGGGDSQIAAGSTTDRNQFAIPEGKVESGVSRQNHPEVAANSGDDVVVEDDFTAAGANVPAPTPSTPTVVKNDTPAVTTPTPAPKPAVASTGSGKSSTSKGGSSSGKKLAGSSKPKKIAKFDKPTLVTYKVQRGDNLSVIAARSHTTVAEIRKASGIKGDRIIAGQTIKVPYTPNGYKPSKADSSKSGKGSSGKSGGSAVKGSGSSYTVRNGDTISAIASRNGVSTAALLKANGLSAQDATKIRAGRKLTIPGKASAAPAKSTGSGKKSGSSAKKSVKKSKKH